MTLLVAGLVLFLGIHSVSIVAAGGRAAFAERFGLGAWKGGYSLVAAVGLGLVVYGFGVARATSAVLLFTPPVPMRHLALLLTLPSLILVLAAYLPGRISRATGHPMLTGVILWSGSHLLANGFLHEVLLFGGFLLWAVADRISLVRRVQGPIPGAPPSPYNDLAAVVGGTALWAALLLGGHRWLFGVAPLPSLNLF